MTEHKKNVVASVLARLRNVADQGGYSFNDVLQLYVIERFLARLAQSPEADTVLLKGALMLRVWGVPRARPTMDIDVLRRGAADRNTLAGIVRQCASVIDETDGVTFDAGNLTVEMIHEAGGYVGTRIRMPARLDNVRQVVQIDFGVGDAVYPSPLIIEYPVLLGGAPLKLRAYPVEATIAEKFQAMVQLDLGNSRMKDFYDIYILSRTLEFDGQVLSVAIESTFKRRETQIPTAPPVALTERFFDDTGHMRQWDAFVTRIDEPSLRGALPTVIRAVAEFLMPPAISAGERNPFRPRWTPRNGWSGL
ncbi:MAG: nucleotidyl transferase AbiEii/AbiGii toxin family protein [Steroidobacteraceae bacterium]